ncbi:MAG: DUF3108 domain-containing protein [Xanthobacteraceae bacterium]|nr:DUF3108 domain-containing protein [Xanthobacteraceae bacterium]
MGSDVPPTLSGFAQLWIAGTVFAIIAASPSSCEAQGKLDARYTASLAGVPIGRGAWIIDVGDDQYTAAASGMTTGILSVFASGKGSGASRGHVRAEGLSPTTYASSITTDNKTEEMRVVLTNGTVKDATITPPTPFNPERLPLTDASKHGVIDPMSGVLMLPPGSGNSLSPEACRRTIPMFDGRMRFDLHMSFRRMDTVRAVKGYQGPAVVCLVQFVPLAGYVPDRPAVKYLVAQRDIEVYLAPLMGTRILIPFKLTVPTPLGQGVIEATQFLTTPTPRLTANSPTH